LVGSKAQAANVVLILRGEQLTLVVLREHHAELLPIKLHEPR
jgi:hypothetical protein